MIVHVFNCLIPNETLSALNAMAELILHLIAAICSRPGCTRARARNPRTGDLHDFCSLKCRYLVTEQDSGMSLIDTYLLEYLCYFRRTKCAVKSAIQCRFDDCVANVSSATAAGSEDTEQ
jgi:hypothetical protein